MYRGQRYWSVDLPGLISYRVDRLTFKATNSDIALALVATFLLPVACFLLWSATGALLPLILYYGIFCLGVVKWRKRSLDYVWPVRWALPLFAVLLTVQLLAQLGGVLTVVPRNDDLAGVVLTLLIWVPINAAAEQLLWAYIFDSFETRWTEGRKRLIGGLLGIFLSVIFVGFIHALFWGQFLPSFESVMPWSAIFFASQFILTIGYLFLYRRTGSMVPIFFIHIIADAALVLGAMYSIVPDLWTL